MSCGSRRACQRALTGWRPAAMLLCALSAIGCVQHRATITTIGATDSTSISINGHQLPEDSITSVSTSPLPISQHALAWHRDESGTLHWDATTIRTPLAWWQRFPADLVTDLVPRTLTSAESATLVLTPSRHWTPAELDQRAAQLALRLAGTDTATHANDAR